jgi:hypothetical protein
MGYKMEWQGYSFYREGGNAISRMKIRNKMKADTNVKHFRESAIGNRER